MEAEKVYQKKVPRTIQHKRNGTGKGLEIADNRSNEILQLVGRRQRSNSYKKERKKASITLRTNIFKNKRSKRKFNDWKIGREAQHLIPFSVGHEFQIPYMWLNSVNNGSMLPSGRKRAPLTSKYIREKHYIRVNHIEPGKGFGHNSYNKTIDEFMRDVIKTKKISKKQFIHLTYVIRIATKKMSKIKNTKEFYVDYINKSDLINLWKMNISDLKKIYSKYSQRKNDGGKYLNDIIFS